MRELERFAAIDADGSPRTIVIRQEQSKASNGVSIPGMIYANLSTGERLMHDRTDTDTFLTVDGELLFRRIPEL